jgi:hypothetical protein
MFIYIYICLYIYIYTQKQHKYSVSSAQQRSYANVIKSNTNEVEDTAITLTKFLNEYKDLINCFNKTG